MLMVAECIKEVTGGKQLMEILNAFRLLFGNNLFSFLEKTCTSLLTPYTEFVVKIVFLFIQFFLCVSQSESLLLQYSQRITANLMRGKECCVRCRRRRNSDGVMRTVYRPFQEFVSAAQIVQPRQISPTQIQRERGGVCRTDMISVTNLWPINGYQLIAR